ncbi:MAG: metallophosphoesterase family protein [Rhodothermales bacterium]
MRIAHLSDVHFGKIGHDRITEAILEDVTEAGADLVIISGDLTQRARHREMAAARDFLQRFEADVMVIPGNHDVYPWWRPERRLFTPLRRYKQYITTDLRPHIEREGLSVLGLSSAHGWTVKGGRLRSADRAFAAKYFAEQPEDAFRILAVHHHLAPLNALGKHDLIRGRKHRAAMLAANIDLVLCGHLHISHVEQVSVPGRQQPVVIASAGTATSTRGRKSNKGVNVYNHILLADDHYIIDERRFDIDRALFETERQTRLARAI